MADMINDPFAEYMRQEDPDRGKLAHAWYFRNALVRANYTDWNKGIRSTTEFLELFLKNLLAGE